MPIYEYRCDDCGHEMEKLQRMSDEPLRDCPACGAPSLRRLVSAAAFRLKGSGWYETDFKKDNQRNLAGDGKPSDGKKEDAAAGKAGDASADKAGPKSDGKSGDKSGAGSAGGGKDSASRTAGRDATGGAAKAGGGSDKGSTAPA